jgi:hypothetical protein
MQIEFTSKNVIKAPIKLDSVALAFVSSTNTISECQLTFQVSSEFYHCINNCTLFNVKSEFRIPLFNGDFTPDRPIQLEITLHPNLLPQLLDHAQTEAEAIAYLLNLSQQQAEQCEADNSEPSLHPLLHTESWFCLSVKQQQDSGKIGYTTFWNYVNPAYLNQPETASDAIATGIANFIQDWAATSLTTATQDIAEDLSKSVTTLFDSFDTWLDRTFPEAKSDRTDNDSPDTTTTDTDNMILESIIEFFTEDDWTFTKLQGQSTLQVVCQGKNGKWNCYAQAREAAEQFVFYSIYPDVAPEDKRLAIAELLTRANYGLIIGNFEMDFDDGEIRYKTSIDVEGDFLTSDLIKQLVYANVTAMDHYFPSIQTVTEGQRSPTEAIAQIEAQFPERDNIRE